MLELDEVPVLLELDELFDDDVETDWLDALDQDICDWLLWLLLDDVDDEDDETDFELLVDDEEDDTDFDVLVDVEDELDRLAWAVEVDELEPLT